MRRSSRQGRKSRVSISPSTHATWRARRLAHERAARARRRVRARGCPRARRGSRGGSRSSAADHQPSQAAVTDHDSLYRWYGFRAAAPSDPAFVERQSGHGRPPSGSLRMKHLLHARSGADIDHPDPAGPASRCGSRRRARAGSPRSEPRTHPLDRRARPTRSIEPSEIISDPDVRVRAVAEHARVNLLEDVRGDLFR